MDAGDWYPDYVVAAAERGVSGNQIWGIRSCSIPNVHARLAARPQQLRTLQRGPGHGHARVQNYIGWTRCTARTRYDSSTRPASRSGSDGRSSARPLVYWPTSPYYDGRGLVELRRGTNYYLPRLIPSAMVTGPRRS